MLPGETEEFRRILEACVGTLRTTPITEDQAKVWFTSLRRYSLVEIQRAFMRWLEGHDRPPTPSAIREIISEMRGDERQANTSLRVQCAWISAGPERVQYLDRHNKPRDEPKLTRCTNFTSKLYDGNHICDEHEACRQAGARAAAGAFV